jgi:hypothetical protein
MRICQAVTGVLYLSPTQESTGVGSTCPTGAEPSTPRRAAMGSSSSAATKTIQEVSILRFGSESPRTFLKVHVPSGLSVVPSQRSW